MLLTPDEEKKVDAIINEGRASEDGVLWLCGLVKRLAAVKPTEEEFDPWAALIDYHLHNPAAFAVRFVERIPVEEETVITGLRAQDRCLLFDKATECPTGDAFLFVRPYIRILEPKSEQLLFGISQHGRIRVEADDLILTEGGAGEDYLVGFDGYGVRRRPFSFHVMDVPKGSGLYVVGSLDKESGQAMPSGRGVFIPNGTRIRIWMSGVALPPTEPVRLSVGLIIGRYTTNEVPGPKPDPAAAPAATELPPAQPQPQPQPPAQAAPAQGATGTQK